MTFKRLALGGLVIAAALSATAEASAQSPGHSWSGFYFGLQAGYGWGDTKITSTAPGGFAPAGGFAGVDDDGAVVGGHVGWQQQWGKWVGGVEVSLSSATLSGSTPSPFLPFHVWRTEVNSLLTATARLGYLWQPSLLTYVKGGYAGGEVGVEFDPVPDPDFLSKDKTWHNGSIIGAGFEYALTRSVTFGLEYNYIDLGSGSYAATASGVVLQRAIVEVDAIHVGLARLTLKFGQ